MFLWLGTSNRTRRVKGGLEQRAFCPDCRAQTAFVEVEIEEKLSLFSVVDLFEDKQRAFRCTECDSVGQLVEGGDLPAGALEDLTPQAREHLERSREAERERLERERREREARADQELLALKQRMGLPPPASADTATADAPDKRPWWRVWRR